MLTPAAAAISRVEAPSKPFGGNTSAAVRMRALVDDGASRALFSAERGRGSLLGLAL